jgi:hypothetical protein
MEGFSMPRSNKGTAGLLNSCPVGLQSLCSIVLGSLLLGLSQATALPQTHTRWDTCPSAAPLDLTTGIPATRPCQTPAQSQFHSSLGNLPLLPAHCPSGPAEPQLHVGQLDPRPSDYPCTSGPAGLQLPVEGLEPCPAGTGTSLVWDSSIY